MRTSIVHHALRALLVGVVAALTGDAVTLADEPPTAVEARSDTKPDVKPAARKNGDDKAGAAQAQVKVIALSGEYVDLVGPIEIDPWLLASGAGPAKRKGFYKLCDTIEEAGKNGKVTHVVFDLSDGALDLNLAQLDELLRRISRLKGAGKRLAAWLEDASPAHLVVAAACDHVAMADFGGVDMPSASMATLFYRDAMELVGVKASVLRAGNFKGAVEPFLNSTMSEHLRRHYLDMLGTMNDALVSMIAEGRGLDAGKVRDLQKRRVLLPAEAIEAGLVDELAPFGSMKATVNRWVGGDAAWPDEATKPKKEMSLFELMGKVMSGGDKPARVADDTIAVMHLSGEITDGKQADPRSIVSGPTVKAIREIARDAKIKGAVVRINSPGGSATASEAIRQALLELKAKKPTVVSMGDVAASGGYWVSCIGVPVYAERGTLTGSIGVFAMKLSFGSLMKRVGLHMENIALDEAAASSAPDRAWNEGDEAMLQKTIDDVYGRFLALVGKSRGIPVEKLDDLAGGRVWSGTQAKQAGLVDEIGGLDDCLAAVAKQAGLGKYSVIHRPSHSEGLDLSLLFGDVDETESRVAGLSGEALAVLRRQGFATTVVTLLLRDALAAGGRRPTVWALGPADITVR